MSNLLAAIERSLRSRSGKKKRKAKRKTAKRRTTRKPKIVFRTRTRTVVRVRRVHVKGHAVRRKTSKKRRAKGKKPSKAEFLRRMALGRARAKRARKH